MRDMRSKKLIVTDGSSMGDELTKGYIREGFGVIQVPDLSGLSASSSDYLLTVMADEIQEFLKDDHQVIVLKRKGGRWTRSLLLKLARRKLLVETRDIF